MAGASRGPDTVRTVAVILALASSLLWGIADFAGGTASRRYAALVVVMASQAAGLVAVALVATVTGRWGTPPGYLPWAVAAGLAGATGLLAYYRALAVGTMGVVSPIAALSVVIPVAVGLASGHWPSAVVGAGIVLAVLGVVAASGPERGSGRGLRPVLLAAGSSVFFGVALLFIARGAAHSPLMTMVGMRVASVLPLAVIFLAVRRPRGRTAGSAVAPGAAGPVDASVSVGGAAALAAAPARAAVRGRLLVVAAGLFDVSANLLFALASTAAALPVVAILGSLYPAVTVVLAWVVHGERLTRMQRVGVAIALVGVALIAGWS